MKKKIFAACLVICLLATAVIGTTLAYFTDKTDTKTNTFTVGGVEITLTEPQWDVANPTGSRNVYPGEVVTKDPTVTNAGESDCLVRVQVTGWDCFGEAGAITAGELGENWELYNDYYYYKATLTSGNPTTAVFSQVTIPTGIDNDTNGDFKLDVIAEAVQAEGFTGDVNSATDLEAWFTTCFGA